MKADTREQRGDAIITLHGSFNPRDLDELRGLLVRLDADTHITIDFHDVGAPHEVAVAKLASDLADARVSVVGLSHHHRRLLRYMGASRV